LNTDTTNNLQLDKLLNETIPEHYKGSFPIDAIKPKLYNDFDCYILNTDISGNPGIHWIGVIRYKGHGYVYDSFDRTYKKMTEHPNFLKQFY
jgi:hypothetical protein